MKIREGDVFRKPSDGSEYSVKKVMRDWIILTSQIGNRQVLADIRSFGNHSSFCKKKGGNKTKGGIRE